LGFTIRRAMCGKGMRTRILIPNNKVRKHLDAIKRTTCLTSHEDSVELKLRALNRIISGWSLYYQYTSKVSAQFSRIEHQTFWLVAHWLCRKYRISMATCMRRFYKKGLGLGTATTRLTKHSSFKHQDWKKGFLVPNPYLTMQRLVREELPRQDFWTGYETRPGWADLRLMVIQRDNYQCCLCGQPVSDLNAEVDHLIPYRNYRRPIDANRLENLWTLCVDCHKRKTQEDRRMESRVQ
jgi:5-methylcytosine-specific restriction endonuclease McrA